ncbi:hypothetical protein GCK72_007414 [Caenorhabditis remanei]|uniref:BTB domain-containing protein n=1 Tax=Caenorhabditis remanei TaxID=31234 RepID=A0A6A5HJ00_CAERE|nr:hypothetical protein GCK72_007414 [Caenorhabditis remanei]KAF1767455.1 hypothetical protein GCK72_007414 [Caenorhabditis remanei]
MSEENDNVAPTNNENDISMEEEEVTQETDGSEKENQDTSRNEIVEKMFEKLLEKQKNIKKSITEIVDKLCSVESELQLIRDDLKPKTVAATVPEQTDDEDETDSESKTESVTMPTTGKYFVLKHVFKNVTNMKEGEDHWSETEEHIGVEWRIDVYRTKEDLSFFLKCLKLTEIGKWSIEAQWKQALLSKSTENRFKVVTKKSFGTVDTSNGTWGFPKFIGWAEMEKDFLVDDQLTAEIHVKIMETTGIYKDNLRSFDETMEEFSDVVLVVNDEKFYVSKLYLAAHSPYFKALVLGNFNDSKKSEIKLTGIDADDFQNYLELLYGEYSIDEFTVEGILLVADMYDTPLIIRKCEEFLLEKSKKTLKKKLQLSMKYHLEALNKQCRKEIKSIADIKSVLPGDIRDLDPSITTEFLEIALSIQ